MKAFSLILLGVSLVGLPACQPQPDPIQCVCQCDGPPPEGAKVTVTSASEQPAVAAAKPAVKPTPAPAKEPPPPAPAANRPTRATGQVAAEPGSGVPVTVTDEAKKEMLTAMEGLAKAAKARDMEGMKKFTTERLGTSLESAVEKHGDRLYRRTDIFSAGIDAGAPVIEQTNDVGDGNFDVQFKFANGETAHLLMFKEEGKWVFNRL